MLLGFHFFNDFFNSSFLADDKCFPEDSHVGFAIHLLLPPCAIGLQDLSVRIGDQPERKLIFGNEILVRFFTVRTHPKDLISFLLETGVVVSQITGLGGASGCVVFRIEV